MAGFKFYKKKELLMAIGFLNTPSTTYIAAAIVVVVVVSRCLPVAYWLVIGNGPAAYHCISNQ